MDILSVFRNEKALQSTELSRLAMLVGCVAKTEQLKEANSLILQGIRAVASISIGAYAALVFAEALDFMDAVR